MVPIECINSYSLLNWDWFQFSIVKTKNSNIGRLQCTGRYRRIDKESTESVGDKDKESTETVSDKLKESTEVLVH